MAAVALSLANLETIAETVLFGPRSDRLAALNAFRVANGDAAVEYLVNAYQPTQGQRDTALAGFQADVSNAVGDAVTGDTEELETLFAAALFGPRSQRITTLNVIRVELGKTAEEYLVNAYQPNRAERDAAFATLNTALGN